MRMALPKFTYEVLEIVLTSRFPRFFLSKICIFVISFFAERCTYEGTNFLWTQLQFIAQFLPPTEWTGLKLSGISPLSSSLSFIYKIISYNVQYAQGNKPHVSKVCIVAPKPIKNKARVRTTYISKDLMAS